MKIVILETVILTMESVIRLDAEILIVQPVVSPVLNVAEIMIFQPAL